MNQLENTIYIKGRLVSSVMKKSTIKKAALQ